MNYLTLENFLEKVRFLANDNYQNQQVKHFLLSNSIQPSSLATYYFWKSKGYTRNLVYRDNFCELLVICWSPGAISSIHGHEGQKCWVRVEQGTLQFQNYREKNRRELMSEIVPSGKPMRAGSGYIDGPTDIHRVANPSIFESATSLHLYIRPYNECDVFNPEKKLVQRIQLQYDTYYGNHGSVNSGHCLSNIRPNKVG